MPTVFELHAQGKLIINIVRDFSVLTLDQEFVKQVKKAFSIRCNSTRNDYGTLLIKNYAISVFNKGSGIGLLFNSDSCNISRISDRDTADDSIPDKNAQFFNNLDKLRNYIKKNNHTRMNEILANMPAKYAAGIVAVTRHGHNDGEQCVKVGAMLEGLLVRNIIRKHFNIALPLYDYDAYTGILKTIDESPKLIMDLLVEANQFHLCQFGLDEDNAGEEISEANANLLELLGYKSNNKILRHLYLANQQSEEETEQTYSSNFANNTF